MLIRRRGLVSVCLCFFCLLALTHKLAAQNCVGSISYTIQRLMMKVPTKLMDCRLYTPSIIDYEQKCPKTTMKCYAEEAKVLIEELRTIEGTNPPPLSLMLDRLAESLNQTNSECPQCELLQEESAEDFLKALKRTLLVISNNAGGC